MEWAINSLFLATNFIQQKHVPEISSSKNQNMSTNCTILITPFCVLIFFFLKKNASGLEFKKLWGYSAHRITWKTDKWNQTNRWCEWYGIKYKKNSFPFGVKIVECVFFSKTGKSAEFFRMNRYRWKTGKYAIYGLTEQMNVANVYIHSLPHMEFKTKTVTISH